MLADLKNLWSVLSVNGRVAWKGSDDAPPHRAVQLAALLIVAAEKANSMNGIQADFLLDVTEAVTLLRGSSAKPGHLSISVCEDFKRER